MIPESVGPIAGANMITSPILPIAAPLFSGGYRRRIVFINTGIINPVPAACNKRPINNIENPGAIALTSVPKVKTTIAPMNTCLVVNHCTNKAEAGISTATTSMYPVESH